VCSNDPRKTSKQGEILMKKTHRIAIAALVAVGAIVYSQLRDKPTNPAASNTSHGRFVVPSGATAFKLGTLDFTACELTQKRSAATTAAFCAPFEVPENWDAPDGRKIGLKLALVKSREAADDDFMVFLAGGPGQAAVDTWPQIASALEPASKRRNVLLLDQRGTGGSHALNCKSIGDEDDASEFDLERVAELTKACLAEVGKNADPRYYTTTAAARDLEALRQALGGPQFDLVGVSYGTRVAQQYLKRHPDGVRSIVLDSSVPNELVLGGEFGRNLDDALKAQFANCTKNADCAKAFGDPYASVIRLRDALRAAPQMVRYPDPVSFKPKDKRLDGYGLAGLVRMFAYSPETAALIPQSVNQALAGNYEPLMGQIGYLTENISELAGSGMQLSVICAEDIDRVVVNPADADTLLGNMLVDAIKTQCSIWPHGERPADFNEPASGDKPILVLAGEFDPVTPPRYGEQVMQHLTNAKLIVAKGQGHNVIGRGCIPKLVSQFMEKLDPKKLDASCVDTIGPIPHFINFNGASP
jgi:pimeloyl-ACP methyl ester carboxylesterase